jgi:hypothetical protein
MVSEYVPLTLEEQPEQPDAANTALTAATASNDMDDVNFTVRSPLLFCKSTLPNAAYWGGSWVFAALAARNCFAPMAAR